MSRRILLPAALALALIAAPATGETVDGRRVIIIDGDTVAVRRERIRLDGIDTPETFRPRCELELVAALRAKERLAQILRSGPVQIQRRGRDRYRRTLARLVAGGRDVGQVLVREGLALPWASGAEAKAKAGRLAVWCGSNR